MHQNRKFLLIYNLIVVRLAFRLSVEELIDSEVPGEDFIAHFEGRARYVPHSFINLLLLLRICVPVNHRPTNFIYPHHSDIVNRSEVVIRHI